MPEADEHCQTHGRPATLVKIFKVSLVIELDVRVPGQGSSNG